MEGGRKGSESVLEERSPAVTEKEAIASCVRNGVNTESDYTDTTSSPNYG